MFSLFWIKKYIKCIVDIVDSVIDDHKIGRKRLLNPKESVLLFLYYLRRYCTLEELSLMFNISVSSAFRYVENMRLIFSKFKFYDNDKIDCKCILIDGTETKIERPIKNKALFYGRKKKYSIKSQVTVDKQSKKIVDVCCY